MNTIHYETILLQTSLIDHLCDNFPKQDVGRAIKKISQNLWQAYKQTQNYDECLVLCNTAIDIVKWYTDGHDAYVVYHAKDITQCFNRIRRCIDLITLMKNDQHNKD